MFRKYGQYVGWTGTIFFFMLFFSIAVFVFNPPVGDKPVLIPTTILTFGIWRMARLMF